MYTLAKFLGIPNHNGFHRLKGQSIMENYFVLQSNFPLYNDKNPQK